MFNQHKKARGYNLVMLLLIVLVGSMGLLISFNSSVSSPTGYLGKEVDDVEQRNHYGWEGDVLLVPKMEKQLTLLEKFILMSVWILVMCTVC